MPEEQPKTDEETTLVRKATEPEAFELYLSMGVERSQDKLWRALGNSAPSLRTLQVWSSKYNWMTKVDEYDKKIHEEIMRIALKKAIRSKADVIEICRAVLARFSQRLLGEEREIYTVAGIKKVMEKYNPDMADAERAYKIIKQEIGEGLPDWTGVKEINLTQIFQQIIAQKNNGQPINRADVDSGAVE